MTISTFHLGQLIHVLQYKLNNNWIQNVKKDKGPYSRETDIKINTEHKGTKGNFRL
jgi:hypothetical protein